MAVQTLIAIASILGAAAFAAAGYVLRGVLRPAAVGFPAVAPAPEPVEVDTGELEAEIQARQVAERQAAEHQRQLSKAQQDLSALQDKYGRLITEMDQQPTQVSEPPVGGASMVAVEQLESEKATLQRKLETERNARQKADASLAELKRREGAQLEAARTLRTEMESLEKQVREQRAKFVREREELIAKLRTAQAGVQDGSALRDEVKQLRAQNEALLDEVASLREQDEEVTVAGAQVAQADARIRELQTQLGVAQNKAEAADALRDEVTALRSRVEELASEGTPAEEVDQLRQKHRDLAVKSEMREARIQELQQYAEDNAAMRERLKTLESEQQETQQLSQRVKELEARLFAVGASAEGGSKKPAAPAKKVKVEGTVGDTLDGQLARLAGRQGCNVAVLADSRGLLLGGSGEQEHFEAVAGLSGSIQELADRAREFLPLGEPRAVELLDHNGVGLRSRLLRLGDETVALSTLGVYTVEDDPETSSVLEALPSVMGHKGA